jgi:ring-1,2-phenylacetyl-CoA epoxidase subunit PaaE
MTKFNTLRISDVRTETPDCVSVAFEVPAALKEEYKFIQGQYLTLKFFIQGKELRRPYSICSGVYEQELRIAIKRVKNGLGSNFIYDHFRKGQEVDVMPPLGSFHSPMNPGHKKNYVLFAGGSGITPMSSIIKTVLKAEPGSTVLLFYGNAREQDIIFREQLDELAEKNPSRLTIYYVLDQPQNSIDALLRGVLTTDKVKNLIHKFVDLTNDNEFFICGPAPMMDNVKNILKDLPIGEERIHTEYFAPADTPAKEIVVPPLEKIISRVTVVQYGIESSFDLASDKKAILDAAIEHGVDAPFSCKGAVCATCRGKLLEGKVIMTKNFALTQAEIDEGFILTCQSHPITPIVKVDYDV